MKTKRKNKYTELRAAIAAVRKVNKGLLRVLPQWRYDGEGAVATQKRAALREAVTAFFREHGKEGEEAVTAFLGLERVSPQRYSEPIQSRRFCDG